MSHDRSARLRRGAWALPVAAVVLLSAGACSSSSSGSGSGGGTTGSGGSTGGGGGKGSIKLVSIIDTGSQGDGAWNGIQAAVKAINGGGGINGKTLNIYRCDTARQPEQAAKCARDAISKGVVAAVGNESGYATQFDPIFEQAKIPVIGSQPYTKADGNSSVVFCISPGFVAATFAEAPLLVKYANAKKVAVAYIDNEAGSALPAVVQSVVGPLGAQVVTKVPMPLTANDFTAQVTKIKNSGAQAVIPILAQSQVDPFYSTLEQLGVTLPIALPPTNGDLPGIAAKYSNLHFTIPGYFNRSSAGWAHFVKDLKAYNGSLPEADYIASGWLDVQLFNWAAKQAATVDSATLLATMNKATHVDLEGMVRPADFTKPNPGLGGAFPRIVNSYYYPEKVENGKLVSLNNWQPINTWST